MSWTRRFIWAFWIFVVVMLLWQFYQYNQKLSTPDPTHQTQDHYFFYQPTPGAAAAPVEHGGPFVEQTGFRVEDSTPTGSSFTCHVTLKNTGKAKAINVEVCVRPFRGTLDGSEDAGLNTNKLLSDDSPRAQINQWITFPDLAPGESSTQSAVFMKQGASEYGSNPKAEISFTPEKKK
jgi:hypothetical protein